MCRHQNTGVFNDRLEKLLFLFSTNVYDLKKTLWMFIIIIDDFLNRKKCRFKDVKEKYFFVQWHQIFGFMKIFCYCMLNRLKIWWFYISNGYRVSQHTWWSLNIERSFPNYNWKPYFSWMISKDTKQMASLRHIWNSEVERVSNLFGDRMSFLMNYFYFVIM